MRTAFIISFIALAILAGLTTWAFINLIKHAIKKAKQNNHEKAQKRQRGPQSIYEGC